MCICMYMSVICVCVYECICVSVLCVYVYVYECICVYLCVSVLCVYGCVSLCVHVCVCVYTWGGAKLMASRSHYLHPISSLVPSFLSQMAGSVLRCHPSHEFLCFPCRCTAQILGLPTPPRTGLKPSQESWPERASEPFR